VLRQVLLEDNLLRLDLGFVLLVAKRRYGFQSPLILRGSGLELLSCLSGADLSWQTSGRFFRDVPYRGRYSPN